MNPNPQSKKQRVSRVEACRSIEYNLEFFGNKDSAACRKKIPLILDKRKRLIRIQNFILLSNI